MRLSLTVLAFLLSINIFSQSVSSPDLPGELKIQIGSNFLIDNPDSMDTGFWGSKAFNAQYLYSVQFGQSAVSFHPGFGIGTDKFSFDNNVTLTRDADGSINITPLNPLEFGSVKKTKLAVTYLEVPLEFRFHFNKDNFKKSINYFWWISHINKFLSDSIPIIIPLSPIACHSGHSSSEWIHLIFLPSLILITLFNSCTLG